MKFKVKDPMSAFTHFIGVILSVFATISLVVKSYEIHNIFYSIGFGVFGVSLILLYSASTIYHTIAKPAWFSEVLHRIDHMMIFVLIAGSYTPICLIPLKAYQGNKLGITVLTIVWVVAFLGIFLKIFWMNAPRWLYTMQYILMGWIAIFAIVPLFHTLSSSGFSMLLAGGILYTIGGVIYAIKKPNLHIKGFGFHEIFHVFVLAGSTCHYLMMLTI